MTIIFMYRGTMSLSGFREYKMNVSGCKGEHVYSFYRTSEINYSLNSTCNSYGKHRSQLQ